MAQKKYKVDRINDRYVGQLSDVMYDHCTQRTFWERFTTSQKQKNEQCYTQKHVNLGKEFYELKLEAEKIDKDKVGKIHEEREGEIDELVASLNCREPAARTKTFWEISTDSWKNLWPSAGNFVDVQNGDQRIQIGVAGVAVQNGNEVIEIGPSGITTRKVDEDCVIC